MDLRRRYWTVWRG